MRITKQEPRTPLRTNYTDLLNKLLAIATRMETGKYIVDSETGCNSRAMVRQVSKDHGGKKKS